MTRIIYNEEWRQSENQYFQLACSNLWFLGFVSHNLNVAADLHNF